MIKKETQKSIAFAIMDIYSMVAESTMDWEVICVLDNIDSRITEISANEVNELMVPEKEATRVMVSKAVQKSSNTQQQRKKHNNSVALAIVNTDIMVVGPKMDQKVTYVFDNINNWQKCCLQYVIYICPCD